MPRAFTRSGTATSLGRRDLPARVADALANAGIDTAGQVARLGRASFEGRPNLRPKTLRELAGRPKARLTAADVVAGALSLSLPPDDAREIVVGAVAALRRIGFRPSASNRFRYGDV